MKNGIYCFLTLLFFSCHQTETIRDADLSLEQINDSEKKNKSELTLLLENENLHKRIFSFGNKTHLSDSCSFYFECDCCSGDLVFNTDTSFYYIDYCMSDQTLRFGTYNLEKNILTLHYDSTGITRKYNYENEIDTSAVDYYVEDIKLSALTQEYNISLCNDKVKLTNSLDEFIALESNSDYGNLMDFLLKEGMIVKLTNNDKD